jgi:HAE1 family hydrophobic/amphiphilic exporter-1
VTKVDDGYSDKTTQVVEILLDRNKLNTQQLTVPGATLGLLTNQVIRQYFQHDQTTPLTTIAINGQDTDVVIETTLESPTTIADIEQLPILATPTGTIQLKDIATVRATTAPLAIRRVNGQTIGVIQARLADGYNDQATVGQITQTVIDYYHADNNARLKALNLSDDSLETYSEGDSASAARSFQDLFTTLILAIIISYIVLAVFFESFTQPFVILFSIPLSFLGVFPALAIFGTGEFGFLEIIGLIILIGVVENVAIFLIDAARQKMEIDQWEPKRAIAYASGVRLRPVILTKCTALASLAPLAFLSETYRPISLVIMFGLLTSGFTSLFTTPILFIFFRWISGHFNEFTWWNKILFFPLAPFYIIGLAIRDRKRA